MQEITEGKKRNSKYQSIKKDLKNKLTDGAWGDTGCLPPERELCDIYQASRMTVRKAVDDLETEGLLYRIHGKGTFVKQSSKINQPLAKLSGFSDDMIARGKKPSSKILLLDIIPASEIVAEKLNQRKGDPVILLRRLRFADDFPMAIETSYLNYNIFKPVYEKISEGSLYALMKQQLNIFPKKAIQSIEVSELSKWEAELLGNESLMVALLMYRQTFDDLDRPIEYVESKYRSDKYKFYIEMKI